MVMSKKKKQNFIVHYLPVFGCISTGIIYGAIGVIAILSFLKLKDGGADESSLLAFLNEFTLGKVLVWIIMLGTVCYIAWRIYETIADPYEYGKKPTGIAKRTGIALSTVADALIIYAAVTFLLGIGNVQEDQQLNEQRQMIHGVLQKNNGTLWVVSIGVAILVTAVVQLYYGVTRGYHERLEVEEFKLVMRKLVHFFGISGYISRGIIIGIVGFFYVKAGIEHDAKIIVNTDKAFDFIGDNIGHLYFILIAAGTIFYGFFMFALGVSYDIDKD
jgi:hypothetical protein